MLNQMMPRLILLGIFGMTSLALGQKQPDYADVVRATSSLLSAQKDANASQTFQSIIRDADYDPAIRSRVMSIYALVYLLQMNTSQFTRAADLLRTTYPAETNLLAEVTPDLWLIPCTACAGTGSKTGTCPFCSGTGTCKLCNGEGKKADKTVCGICKGAGKCYKCEGKKTLTTPCLTCNGSGRVFQLSPRIKAIYETLLAETQKLAADNIRIADASKKAAQETSLVKRIAALKALIEQDGARFALNEQRQLLAKAEAELKQQQDAEDARKKEQEAREREEREYSAIQTALETLPMSGIPVMIQEIDRFVTAHPQSARRLELEISKNKLESRLRTQRYLWYGFYTIMGLVVLTTLYTTIKDYLARRKKPNPIYRVPGLDTSSRTSDPLGGTLDALDDPDEQA